MEKIYIPGCTNCPYMCPKDLYSALVRAKVWFQADRINFIMYITSRNSDAPLTPKEKCRLVEILNFNDCPYKIVFDN